MTDSQKALEALTKAGVEFVVIGGAAMVAHGSAYVTRDLDICYGRSVENIRRLAQALQPFHPQLRGAPAGPPFHFDEGTIKRGLNFTLTTDLGDIDILGEVAGLGSFAMVRAASETMAIYERDCLVLTLEGLTKAKRAAGRPRDLEALKEIEALRDFRRKAGK
jgi:hypothetical protein